VGELIGLVRAGVITQTRQGVPFGSTLPLCRLKIWSGNGQKLRQLSGMTDLKSRIAEEIGNIQAAMEKAKHQIKQNTANGLPLVEPEQTLRELRTRLAVLEANFHRAEESAIRLQ
jgi:hypothetical protein